MSGYRERIGQTFKELNTTPDEWTPCEIVGFETIITGGIGSENIREIPMWKTPNEYKSAVTRFSGSDITNCHLCNHPIMNLYFIQCDRLKLIMQVGSECVENYDLAKIVENKKSEWKSKIVKEEFDLFVPKIQTAFEGQKKKKFWVERWLWDANKAIKDGKIDTTRKAQNFLKKYKPKLEEAILGSQLKAAGVV